MPSVRFFLQKLRIRRVKEVDVISIRKYKLIVIALIVLAVLTLSTAFSVSYAKWTSADVDSVGASVKLGYWYTTEYVNGLVDDANKNGQYGIYVSGGGTAEQDPDSPSSSGFKKYHRWFSVSVKPGSQLVVIGPTLGGFNEENAEGPIRCNGQYNPQVWDGNINNPSYSNVSALSGADSTQENNGQWLINNYVHYYTDESKTAVKSYVRYLGDGIFEVSGDAPVGADGQYTFKVEIKYWRDGIRFKGNIDVMDAGMAFN